ncbi:RAD52 motif-containing protein 1 [Carassius auratus]|uniref:RAD52 motif-containing protein 1 n=2 Tax=Cyprinidae TaxID=7953 RepID=A0A6P6JUM7_CARAU|nr:RAD52 motif-containing protein 1 [Carassius auratus]XP_026063581.1 RAD52 motif-containing protein 1 [Carassius auratus]XP_052407317.1 RAD52 motif-containing protein 1 [Carassius gibelio]
MDIEVDIIDFKVPLENNKTIFVWDIQPTFSEAYIYESLWSVYSAFGALYLLKVCPNATVAEPGFYALVKFYSSAQASKAQRATDKQCLFQRSPLKVRLSTKQNLSFYSSKPLSLSKCHNLANHYLGFGGWSTRIVTLKDISRCRDAGCQEETDDQSVLLKYGCIAELTFQQHGMSCQGVGVAEEIIDNDRDPEEKLRKRGTLMKRAKDKAVVAAFEKVLLMILGNGKVAIEIKYDPDEILPEENSGGVIKVNDISWNEFEDADSNTEEDFPWDLTVDLPH